MRLTIKEIIAIGFVGAILWSIGMFDQGSFENGHGAQYKQQLAIEAVQELLPSASGISCEIHPVGSTHGSCTFSASAGEVMSARGATGLPLLAVASGYNCESLIEFARPRDSGTQILAMDRFDPAEGVRVYSVPTHQSTLHNRIGTRLAVVKLFYHTSSGRVCANLIDMN